MTRHIESVSIRLNNNDVWKCSGHLCNFEMPRITHDLLKEKMLESMHRLSHAHIPTLAVADHVFLAYLRDDSDQDAISTCGGLRFRDPHHMHSFRHPSWWQIRVLEPTTSPAGSTRYGYTMVKLSPTIDFEAALTGKYVVVPDRQLPVSVRLTQDMDRVISVSRTPIPITAEFMQINMVVTR